MFSNPRLSACSGSLLESKLEKSSWNSPGEQKGFCAGGFGGRGCFHCRYLNFYFLPAKEHLPAAPEEVGCCPCTGGNVQARGRMPSTPTGSGSRALSKTFMRCGVQDLPEPFGQASRSLPWLWPSHGRQGGLCSSMRWLDPKKSPKRRVGAVRWVLPCDAAPWMRG